MKNQANDMSETKTLRQKAEDELIIIKLTQPIGEVDNLKFMHELEVHQIELQMQNDELVKARDHAEMAMEKYTDLYDFAPSGYVTLSQEGEITDLNFSAGIMLGKDRIYLKNSRLGLYVSQESLGLFNDFIDALFQFRMKQSCELFLLSSHGKLNYVHIDALVPLSTNICLLTIIDISERKKMEIELQKTLNEYKNLNSFFVDRELKMIDLKKRINELLTKSGCEKEYLI